MKQKEQLEQEPSQNKLFEILVNYMNILINSVIFFLVIGFLGSFILIGFLKIKPVVAFICIFLLSVLISPIYSKLKFGERITMKYIKFLQGYIWKTQK